MPPKRKASSISSSSPAKRLATGGPETSSHQAQSTATATSSAKRPPPKLRRTYGKKSKRERVATEPENFVVKQMDDIPSDAIPEPEQATPPPEKAREHRVDAISTPKQQSKRRTDALSPVRPTYVFESVEIPPHPQHKRIPPSLPTTDETHRPPSSPKITADATTLEDDTECTAITGVTANHEIDLLLMHEPILSQRLPPRFYPCLDAQKSAILRNLRDTSKLFDPREPHSPDTTSVKQLEDLLMGTIARSEGNSCLLLGPRGSGKSKVAMQLYLSYNTANSPYTSRYLIIV
jgi:origin recognition complex subunit 4